VLDPKNIDVNIHQKKTEVKFTDDKTVYMLLLSAIKRALGKAGVSPSIDFESSPSFQTEPEPGRTYTMPKVSYNEGYNPFNVQVAVNPALEKANRQNWDSLFEGFRTNPAASAPEAEQQSMEDVKKEAVDYAVLQLNNKYIVTINNQDVLIVDQQRAHERILYEHYVNTADSNPVNSQQLLFPEQMELSASDFGLVKELLADFKTLGFDLEIFGKNSIVVNGTPADMRDFNVVQTIEGILETFKINTIDARVEKHENLCRAIARNMCIKYGKTLEAAEMKMLLKSLFGCENPLYTAGGKLVMMEVAYSEIEKFFKR
jgi:DNA mismatch repair protein MutL